jgi:hypothetical protein
MKSMTSYQHTFVSQGLQSVQYALHFGGFNIASGVGNTPCLPVFINKPIIDRDSPSSFSKLELPSHLFLFKQKTTSTEWKFNHFSSSILYCLKPKSIF